MSYERQRHPQVWADILRHVGGKALQGAGSGLWAASSDLKVCALSPPPAHPRQI